MQKIFLCTFLLIEKYQKIKTANKSAKIYFVTLCWMISNVDDESIQHLTLHSINFLTRFIWCRFSKSSRFKWDYDARWIGISCKSIDERGINSKVKVQNSKDILFINFLDPDSHRGKLQNGNKRFLVKCSFLVARKEPKETRTDKTIARIFLHYAKAKELPRQVGVKQLSPLYASFRKIL